VTPEEFERWKDYALELGFGVCESGPMIRSSYHADEQSNKFEVRARRMEMLAAQKKS
jgi:lipoic acid synthetase